MRMEYAEPSQLILRLAMPIRGLCFALLILTGLMSSAAGEVRHGQGLLWRITPSDGLSSFIYGTMHSDDPRVLDLPEPAQRALTSARTVVLEADLNPEAIDALMRTIWLPHGQTLTELLDQATLTRTLAALSDRGIPPVVALSVKPWVASVMLVRPQPATGEFLDLALAAQAKAQGKPVHGLETAEEQLAALDAFSLEQQVLMLKLTLAQLSQMPALQERLLEAYLKQDLAGLVDLSEESLSGAGVLADTFNARLIESRNHRMVERMLAYLQTGCAFVAVGALHLPGEEGILNLLEQRGYQVSPVY